MIITGDIIEKCFSKYYDPNKYKIISWEDQPQYNRVDVEWSHHFDFFTSSFCSIPYNQIIEEWREQKLKEIGI